MDYNFFLNKVCDFFENCPENYVSSEDALRPDLIGMQIFDPPIFGVAASDDPLFKQLQAPGVVGPGAFLPADWLPEANSVLSFFLPFTESVRRSNRLPGSASDEWLHARIEGQIMLDRLGAFICSTLEGEGFPAVYPLTDPRRHMIAPLIPNWSERHVAYVCGLGTFGLSKGLITEKGTAGRVGSVITSAVLPPTHRAYESPFEYCIMCGKCQRNCPAKAIDTSKGVINGKDNEICATHVYATKLPPHGPNQRKRYGCGKCQVGVPCESRIPGKRST